MGPSHAESVQIGSLFKCSGVPFGSLEGPCSHHESYFGIIRPAFGPQNMENTHFVILMPLCSETTTFERLGCRVGASRAPKMVSRTVRTAKPGDFGRLVCRSYGTHAKHYGKVMKSAGNQVKSEDKVYLTDKSYD